MANHKVTRIIGASVLAGVLILSGCGGGEERQAKYLDRAQNYFDEENFEKAKIEIKNVLQINPNHSDARYMLGMIAEKDKDFRQAFGNFNAALEEDPNHINALAKVANYYLMSNDLENAEENATTLLAADPNSADALAIMASVMYKKALLIRTENEKFADDAEYTSLVEKAAESAQKARATDPGHVQAVGILTAIYAEDDPDMALSIIGDGIENQSENESLKMLKIRLLSQQNRRDDVIGMFKELMVEYPDNLLYPFQLVNFYLKDDRLEEDERKNLAETTLKDLVKAKPEEEVVKLWLVEFINKNRTAADGLVLLEAYVKEHPDSFKLRDRLAALYLQAKEVDKALSLYTPVIDADPTGSAAITARTRLIEITLSVNRRKQAEIYIAEVFELDPENSQALVARAKLKVADNDLEGAIPDLRVILKNDPESVSTLAMLGAIHERNNTPELALDSYQRLLSVQPENLVGLLGSARVLIAKNQPADALPLLEAAAKVDAANPETVRLLTDLYSRDQRWDDALSVSAKLTEVDDTMAVGHYLQGRTYLRKKDLKKAIESLEKSHKLAPSGIEVLSSLIGAYVAMDDADKAKAYVEEHLKAYPEHAHAQELLGTLYAREGDGDRAVAILEKLLEAQPARISTYRVLTRIYASQGRLDIVEKMYLNGLDKKPDNVELRLMLAEVYQSTDRFEQAIESYELVLKDNPDALVVKNNLASMLMDHANTPDNLTRIAELSADLGSTENPAFLDTAGWAQYQMGNYPQAVSLLGAAVERGGIGPVYRYHLGMAYFKSEMKAQAKEQLELALEQEQVKFVGKDEAEQTLGQL